jgi:hypothetical protein
MLLASNETPPAALSLASILIEVDTVQPLSISADPVNVTWSLIVQPLPVLTASLPVKLIEAPPVAVSSAAFAETDTRAPANAVSPIFFNVHINYSLY